MDKEKELQDFKQSVQQAYSILKLLESDMVMHNLDSTHIDTVQVVENLLKKVL